MSIHDKCKATKKTEEEFWLICGRSKGHDVNPNPSRAEHYDPSAEEYWSD